MCQVRRIRNLVLQKKEKRVALQTASVFIRSSHHQHPPCITSSVVDSILLMQVEACEQASTLPRVKKMELRWF